MPKEWIDIADTAVKIGFGSLITGVFTYLGIKFARKSERRKFVLEHKTKLLEKAAEDVEEYFFASDSYFSKIAGITKNRKNNETEEDELDVKQKQVIKERDQNLVESWSKRESAVSKLRLMKANNAAKALESCREQENELRDRIVFKKEVPRYDEIIEYWKSVMVAQEYFHKKLADFYDTLQT